MDRSKQNIKTFSPHGVNALRGCAPAHPQAGTHRRLQRLGPVYLSKLDLADSYVRLWVRMEDVLSVAFLITKKDTSDT